MRMANVSTLSQQRAHLGAASENFQFPRVLHGRITAQRARAEIPCSAFGARIFIYLAAYLPNISINECILLH
jgi:hypothetical protein